MNVRLIARIKHRLPELYLVFALSVTGLLCVVTAPFFGPDEANQACRAISLSHGQVIAESGPDEAGGQVDRGVLQVMEGFNQIRMAWEKRASDFHNRPYGAVTEAQQERLANARWSHLTVFVPFGNTAPYPPMLYLPAVMGWRLAEALDLTIFDSLRLVRLVCAITAVGLGWLALRLCACSRWMLLPFLLLPSVLFLNASCSQDSILMSGAALVAACLSRPLTEGRDFTRAELLVTALLLTLCATARPPNLGMALVVLVPAAALRAGGWKRWIEPALALALVLAAAALWRYEVAGFAIDTSDIANPDLQAIFVRSHPLQAAAAILTGTVEAASDFWRRGFYVIGWNDLLAPRFLSLAVGAGLILVVLLEEKCPVRTRGGVTLLTVAVVLPLLGVSAAEYLIWTPPGLGTVYGIQPRYWLPMMPLAMLLLQGRVRLTISNGTRSRLLSAAGFLLAGVAGTLPWVAAHAFYRLSLGQVLHLNLR